MDERKKPSINFVNLHGHSTFSYFDGLGYPQDIYNYVYENGMDACAITDHGNMNCLSYQYTTAKRMEKEEKKKITNRVQGPEPSSRSTGRVSQIDQ